MEDHLVGDKQPTAATSECILVAITWSRIKSSILDRIEETIKMEVQVTSTILVKTS